MRMKQVVVSRELLIGLGAGCAAALLALAFMLGRASGGSRSSLPAPAAQAPVSPPPAEPQAAPPAEPAAPPEPMPTAAPAPQAPRPAAPSKVAGPEAGVASYFQAVERIQPGQMGGNPEAMAKGVLEGLVKGDASGIDDMIRQSEAARASLGALSPPAPCAAFHRDSLAALDDSLGVLRSLRTAMQAGSMPADFATRAELLRTHTEKLQKEEKALRERYGLVP
jgi:hypothetical protein